MLGARGGQGGPGLAGTFGSHGKVPWKPSLSMSICEMNGLDRNSVPHKGARGKSHGLTGATCPIQPSTRDHAVVAGEQSPIL